MTLLDQLAASPRLLKAAGNDAALLRKTLESYGANLPEIGTNVLIADLLTQKAADRDVVERSAAPGAAEGPTTHRASRR